MQHDKKDSEIPIVSLNIMVIGFNLEQDTNSHPHQISWTNEIDLLPMICNIAFTDTLKSDL